MLDAAMGAMRYALRSAATLSLIVAAVGCGNGRVVSDHDAQAAMIETSLRQFAQGDPRRLVLGDDLLFDSLKTPRHLDGSVKRTVVAHGAAAARCPQDAATAGCATVNVSLPVRAGTDTAIVYVSSRSADGHSYVSRAYRFARGGGGWTPLGEVPY